MGKELKEYIIGKKHHAFRRDFPEYQNLAQEYHRLGLSPKERMTRRFELLSGLETPVLLPVINAAIDQAIAECKAKGIHGKETTPFLLARVAEITGGDSLASNIRLVYNNAKVAAQTAAAYCKL